MSRNALIGCCMVAFSLGAMAQTDTVGHAVHHPGNPPVVSSAEMPASRPTHDAQMAGMDEHIKAMQSMHEKMMAAKTPEERQALMAEHMKLMHDGMAMMRSMGGMSGMGGMGGMGATQAGKGMDGDMAMRQQMMEKRMDMMELMMQMMMDRMPSGAPN